MEEGQVQYFQKLKEGLQLVLSVSYAGTKTWRAQCNVGGKPRSASLGSYPDMSLADAKEAAFEFDPNRAVASSEETPSRTSRNGGSGITLKTRNSGPGTRSKRYLKVCVYPHWQKKPLFDIRRIDVNILLDHIQRKHGPC